jgi:hypothetical protein
MNRDMNARANDRGRAARRKRVAQQVAGRLIVRTVLDRRPPRKDGRR